MKDGNLTKGQLKELDRLADQLTEKCKELDVPLFLLFGKDREGFDCSGRFEGCIGHLINNLTTAQTLNGRVKEIVMASIFRSNTLSKDKRTLIIESEVHFPQKNTTHNPS